MMIIHNSNQMKRRISNERKKRSWVWEYFIEDNEKVEPDKSTNWVKCKIDGCHTPSIKMKNRSTSNLAYHLKQVHGILQRIIRNDLL